MAYHSLSREHEISVHAMPVNLRNSKSKNRLKDTHGSFHSSEILEKANPQ